MASVFLAIQESLDRRVALKVLKKFDTPEQSERFVNEGRIIASLNHRNIITIHDIGRVDGRPYISMEYLRGGDLEQRIRAGIAPDAALDLTRTLGRCLAFLHDRGIVHRDIKPANVLFQDDDNPVLTDFGIAKQMHRDTSLTMDGSALGSPDYLSPEQAECKPLDGRADIYSLGIMLFEMLTGEKPYRGDSYIETVMAHITRPIPDLPRPLKRYQELVDRMIAKKPEDRFATAADLVAFLDDLDSARPAGGVSAKLAGFVSGLHRPAPAKPAPAPTQEISREELHPEPAVVDGEAAPPPDGSRTVGSRGPLRYLLLAAGLLVLVAGAVLTTRAPTERPVTDAPPLRPTEVERHLASARAALEADRLTTPPEDNAYFHYRKALALEPGNEAAAAGIARIADRFADSAEQQLAQDNPDAARLQIENGLSIQPDAPRLLALQQRIRDLENAEIEDRLLRAKVAMEANRLTTPADDNAYDHYREVLALRPGHEEAVQGIAAIADRYAELAAWKIDEYEYADAKVYVRKGLDIRPDHPRLLALQERTNAVKDVPNRIIKGIKSVFD